MFSAPPRRRFEDKLEALGGSPLEAHYDAQKPEERAELSLDEFTPRFDNPLLASSLVPPPSQARAKGFLSSVTLAVVAAAVGGLAVWFALEDAPAPQTAGRQESAVPAVASQQAMKRAEPNAAPATGTKPAQTTPVPTALISHPVSGATLASEPKVIATVPAHTTTAESSVRSTTSAIAAVEPTTSDNAEDEPPADSASTQDEALPNLPERADVVAGFEHVRSDLERCTDGKHGVAEIEATIANSGRIGHALVTGSFQGTPEGSCIARAVRGARFPRFAQPSLKVSYPVSL